MRYYRHHVFFCLNDRGPDTKCCISLGAFKLFNYAKNKIKELDLSGKSKVRVNKAGCLGRCLKGPIVVIYPEGIWYQCKTTTDIDEIIEYHLKKEKIVSRLQLNIDD